MVLNAKMFKILCCSLLFVMAANGVDDKARVFNIVRYGAKPDGKSDTISTFKYLWKSVCGRSEDSIIYVPPGTFYLSGINFVGPCKSKIEFVINGTLLAPTNHNDVKQEMWLNFQYINHLFISGNGTLDGQGSQSWLVNDCRKNAKCPKLAMNMGFAFVNTTSIKGITSLNSKMGHINLFCVNDFNITDVNIIAPKDSPNTDGIKIALSNNMHISRTYIGTGDDCIAILHGTTGLDISNVTCGPGHGISVGSIGNNKEEKDVKDLKVRDSIFNGTSDGIRIKTWESSAASIVISNLVYENIQMINVGKPINIDQRYCPYPPCAKRGESHVQIQDMRLQNIYGTSVNKVAMNLQCSKSCPCKNVRLIDINLTCNGSKDGPSIAVCENVDGSAFGKMVPPHCVN